MNTEEIIKELREMQNKLPVELDDETKKLFDAIMKIADERDSALIDVKYFEYLLKEKSNKAEFVLKILDTDKEVAKKLLREIVTTEEELYGEDG